MSELATAMPVEELGDALNETDRRVLQAMLDGDQHTAPELATRLGASREYLNTRLSHMNTFGFVERVERGVYRLDTNGRALASEGKA